jgi:hypothetical protein
MLVGGPVGAVGHAQWPLPQAPRYRFQDVRPLGNDLLLRMVPLPKEK